MTTGHTFYFFPGGEKAMEVKEFLLFLRVFLFCSSSEDLPEKTRMRLHKELAGGCESWLGVFGPTPLPPKFRGWLVSQPFKVDGCEVKVGTPCQMVG